MESDNQQSKKGSSKGSSLPTPVQNLINLIFDMKLQDKAMEEIGYDPKKMPLGQLGEESIKEAYKVLTKILELVNNKAKN